MKTSTKILIGILLVCLGVIFWQYKNPRTETKYVSVPAKIPPPQIIYTTAKNGNQVATFKTPEPVLEPQKVASEELLNTVKNIQEIDEKTKVTEITKIATELQLKLAEKDLALNDKENEVKIWKDKFNEVNIDNKNNTAFVRSDASPVIVDYEKRLKWYKAKEGFTSITSENPSIVFNGVETYEIKRKEVKDIFELTLDGFTGQFYNDRNFDKSLRFYDASLNLVGNPDGRIRPFVNIGARTYNFQNASLYWGFGAKILIVKY